MPAEFPKSSLRHDAERVVVQTPVDRLSDGWLVMPSVGLADVDRDGEVDVVVAHRHDGVAVIDVKGHQPTVRDGLWYAHGRPMQPQPHEQARGNALAGRTACRDRRRWSRRAMRWWPWVSSGTP